MFCKNCGAEIKEGSKFCTYCGAQLAAGEQSQINTNSSVLKEENIVISKNQEKKINTRLIVKIVALISIISFILPFAMVSCSLDTSDEKSNKCTVSGLELAFGVDKKFDYQNPIDGSNSTEKHEVKVNVCILLALITSVVCICFIFKEKYKITALLSIIAIILLVIFSSTIDKYLRSLGLEAEMIKYLVVDLKFGYYLCFICQIIVLLLSLYSLFTDSKGTQPAKQILTNQ